MKKCNVALPGNAAADLGLLAHRCNRAYDHFGVHECACGFQWENPPRYEVTAAGRAALAQADGDSATGARRS